MKCEQLPVSRLQHNNFVYNCNLAYDSQNTEQIKKHKFYNQCRSRTVSAKYGRAWHNKYLSSQPPPNKIHIQLRSQTSQLRCRSFVSGQHHRVSAVTL